VRTLLCCGVDGFEGLAEVVSEPEIDLAKLAAVSAPTLVLQGDRDEVTPSMGAAVAAALGDGRLAVLPGTHGLPVELPEVVNPLLISFPARSIIAPLTEDFPRQCPEDLVVHVSRTD
jgi:pimeloyl-ACP methyl ester carboxylesterase